VYNDGTLQNITSTSSLEAASFEDVTISKQNEDVKGRREETLLNKNKSESQTAPIEKEKG